MLLPVLSSFLASSVSSWFKEEITTQLSLIPLREDGIIQIITFIASQFAPSLGHEAEESTPDRPAITVQAIMQIAKLLSSVPRGMNPEVYIQNIAPKLLALLDGEDPDLKKVASYVIGSGILMKRSLGGPDAVGRTVFLQPMLDAFNANITEASRFWLRLFPILDPSHNSSTSGQNLEGERLVSEAQLRLSIERLSALTQLHPNPGLLKRIIPPVLLPLWGLTCFSKEHEKPWWQDKTSKLLEVYFSISGGGSSLKKIADHLLWDGTQEWTFGPGDDGGISIRKRSGADPKSPNLILLMQSLDSRAEQFLDFLKVAPQADEATGDIFLHVSQKWLLEPSPNEAGPVNRDPLQDDIDSERAFRKLVSAKIAEKLLERFKDTLSRHPLKVLELIQHLIGNEIDRQGEKERKSHGLGNATLSSLGNIVQKKEDGDNDDKVGDDESVESLSSGFSLLSTMLTSPDFSVSETSLPVLEKIKSQLDQVIQKLPSPLSQPATTASMLLEIQISTPSSSDSQTQSSSLASDLETHRQAVANISSSTAPIQVEGLTALSGLISKSSPILDIPSTISLLLSLITGSNSDTVINDEFVYLNAIKAMGSLAPRHPRTAIRTLVDRYSDTNEEESLDQRLRIGEALLRTVQELGDALVGETVTILANSMISVAGRRGKKPQARKAREEKLRKERANLPDQTASNASSSQSKPQPEQAEDEDSETEDPEQGAHAAGILDAWAAGAVSDDEPEDLRVRASAMSILATALETNIAGIGPSIASSSVDLALSTLTLEPGPESAILRRAAVILILDLVKAIDSAREESGSDLGFGFGLGATDNESGNSSIANIHDVLRVLRFVESRETDTIVRGHIRTLIENLDAWVEKSLMWGIGAHSEGRMDMEPRFEIDSERLAGLDIQPLSGGRNKSKGRGPLVEEIE